MNTNNIIGHDAAAQQVRAVIESLDQEGSTPTHAGDAKAPHIPLKLALRLDFLRCIFVRACC